MGFILDFSLWPHMGQIRYFDLLKAFGYIKRVVKSDLFWKRPILYHRCTTCSELSSYITTMKFMDLVFLRVGSTRALFELKVNSSSQFPQSAINGCILEFTSTRYAHLLCQMVNNKNIAGLPVEHPVVGLEAGGRRHLSGRAQAGLHGSVLSR